MCGLVVFNVAELGFRNVNLHSKLAIFFGIVLMQECQGGKIALLFKKIFININ